MVEEVQKDLSKTRQQPPGRLSTRQVTIKSSELVSVRTRACYAFNKVCGNKVNKTFALYDMGFQRQISNADKCHAFFSN